jgi:medium-chain acyl-[acyl-carrier-protein] hydrolase
MNSSGKSKWIRRIEVRPEARWRILCFPHAVAGAGIYHGWGRSFPSDVEVGALQLPGREDRLSEQPYSRMEPLVEAMIRATLPWIEEKPCVFFGHSMGALIAFELARRLPSHGASAALLFISGRPAPQLSKENRLIHKLPKAGLIAELRRTGATPESVLSEPELLELILPIMRADYSLIETYRFHKEPLLEIPMTVFGGIDDPEVTVSELDAWRPTTTSYFSRFLFPGGHFYLNDVPDLIARSICRRLSGIAAM